MRRFHVERMLRLSFILALAGSVDNLYAQDLRGPIFPGNWYVHCAPPTPPNPDNYDTYKIHMDEADILLFYQSQGRMISGNRIDSGAKILISTSQNCIFTEYGG